MVYNSVFFILSVEWIFEYTKILNIFNEVQYFLQNFRYAKKIFFFVFPKNFFVSDNDINIKIIDKI